MKKTLKETYKDTTKKLIYDTAITLFKEQEYEKITVQKICDNCGIAKGTFYLNFKSKEDIIRISFSNGINSYLIEKMKKMPNLTIREQLVYYLKTCFDYCNEVGKATTTRAFIFNLNQTLTTQESSLLNQETRLHLEKIINTGTSLSIWSNTYSPEEIHSAIISYILGTMMSWCFSSEDYNINEKCNNIILQFVDQFISK